MNLAAPADLSRFLSRKPDGSVTFDAMVRGARCAGCGGRVVALGRGVGATSEAAAAHPPQQRPKSLGQGRPWFMAWG